MLFRSLIVALLIGAICTTAQRIGMPEAYLCYLGRLNDCLERVPRLPAEWNITDPMAYCKDQTRPRDPLTRDLCAFDDANCAQECPVAPIRYEGLFEEDDGPLESVSIRRVTDPRYPFPTFWIKWLALEGSKFYVVQQWSDAVPTPYYYETKMSFITIPSWGSCTQNYVRVASVINSKLRFFSAPANMYDEPRFPLQTSATFNVLDKMMSNDSANTDFLPDNGERLVYVRVGFRLGVFTSMYDISQIGEATMFSPNCRLDFISLYPKPIKLPGGREFLFTFPESYAAKNCTVAVKVHNLITRCNQTISTSLTDQTESAGSPVSRARQRFGMVAPSFLIDRLQAMKQLRIQLDCRTIRNYNCDQAAELLKPSCGVTSVDVLPDPEPGTYWLVWGALLHQKNLPIRSWVVFARHVNSNDTRRFILMTNDNTPADYGTEFRSDRRLQLALGASRVTYTIQVCAVYDRNTDQYIDTSTAPERVIHLFDEIAEGVARPRPTPNLIGDMFDSGDLLGGDVAVSRMEIVRRSLSDRMIIALAVGVALALSIAICVPLTICRALRNRHPQGKRNTDIPMSGKSTLEKSTKSPKLDRPKY